MKEYTYKTLMEEATEFGKSDSKTLLKEIKELDKYLNTIYSTRPLSNFLTDNKIGIIGLNYTARQMNVLYDDIFKINTKTYLKNKGNIKGIDKTWNAATDMLNVSMLYGAHVYLSTNKISIKKRLQGARYCMAIFCFRTLIANHNRYFTHPISEEVSHTVYNNLTAKYILKKEKTWSGVLSYRIDSFFNSGDKVKKIEKFDDENDIKNIIADVIGGFSSTFKHINVVYKTIMTNKSAIKSISLLEEDMKGAVVLANINNNVTDNINALLSTIYDPDSFIKNDIIDFINNLNKNHDIKKDLKKTLFHISTNYSDEKYYSLYRDFINETVIYGVNYANGQKEENESIDAIIRKVHNAFASSRCGSNVLLDLRERGDSIVKNIIKNNNKQIVSNVRLFLLLYLFIFYLTISSKK